MNSTSRDEESSRAPSRKALRADVRGRAGIVRQSERQSSSAKTAFLVAGLAAAGIAAGVLLWGWDTAVPAPITGTDPAFAATYSFYEMMPLPDSVARRAEVAKLLGQLQRERCDWDALYELSNIAFDAGYKRDAANALVAYSHKCREATTGLMRAADIYGGLADYPAALKVADELVTIDADQPSFHYLRGQIQEEAGRYREAIDSYTSLLELTDDLNDLDSGVFQHLADSYAALGRYCEAMTPIQTWMALDPANNETQRAQAKVAAFAGKGHCGAGYANGQDRFPIRNRDVIMATVEINGRRGTFIVDTGASTVALTQAFARQAGVQLDDVYDVRVETANGIALAQSVTLAKVRLGGVEANNVVALVSKDKGLGKGIDGLLGRSFLSRFDVTFGSREWAIKSR